MNTQLVFNIISIIFLLWMCFRWSTNKFYDLMIKIILFVTSFVGMILVAKQINLI